MLWSSPSSNDRIAASDVRASRAGNLYYVEMVHPDETVVAVYERAEGTAAQVGSSSLGIPAEAQAVQVQVAIMGQLVDPPPDPSSPANAIHEVVVVDGDVRFHVPTSHLRGPLPAGVLVPKLLLTPLTLTIDIATLPIQLPVGLVGLYWFHSGRW